MGARSFAYKFPNMLPRPLADALGNYLEDPKPPRTTARKQQHAEIWHALQPCIDGNGELIRRMANAVANGELRKGDGAQAFQWIMTELDP